MSKLKQIDTFIEKIITESLEDIVSERFARYSKYIIQDRALPDARDGLKPVQRRILYAMHQMGMLHNKPYKKSARIAGEVMGKYHPHGDSSIYEAMVRLSQDFKMGMTLIDMHGNNGSIDGDPAAAMRYTEARLSRASEALLKDIDKRTVPFVPNFDDEEVEPVVLPSKFPNLLVNGAMGISSGYATKIPPHNLREIIEATMILIDEEDVPFEKIAGIIKGPDFPTGGIVQGKAGILQALETGTGKVVVRARSFIEEMSKTQDRIVVTEIPYEVNKADLVKSIDMLRVDKRLEDILEVRDETDQEGLRIAIDLKKGSDANFILNYLFKNTDMQISYNYNMVAILNNRPELVGVIPILKAYINHQKDVMTNRSNYELERATKRQHIVEGLIKMVSVVDEIIKIIRSSNNKAESKANIMEAFGFSDLQAEAIVTLQLYRLSNTDVLALQKENDLLSEQIKHLNHLLTNERALKKAIKDELKEVSDKLGYDRKSEIEEEISTIRIDEKELVSEEQVYIGITKDGYVKRASVRSYQASQSIGLKNDDALIFEKEVKTTDTLLLFTNLGNYIFLPVFKIDEQKWKDLGVYINNIISIEKDERILKVFDIENFDNPFYLLLATKQGMMKQVKLKDFEVSRYSKSMRAMRLSKNDELVSVDMHQKRNIIAVSKDGYVLRFKTDELPLYGTQAGGVKSMALGANDELAEAFYAKSNDEIALLTIRGHVIKDEVDSLPAYSRNRRGIRVVEMQKLNPHYVVSAARISKEQTKENVSVLVVTDRVGMKYTVNDLKYTQNKFGKKLYDIEKLGLPYLIEISEALTELLDDEPDDVVLPKKLKTVEETKKEATIDIVKEEIVVKNNKKIRLSRLDLFDDNDID